MAFKDKLRPNIAALSVGLILGSSFLQPLASAETIKEQNVPKVNEVSESPASSGLNEQEVADKAKQEAEAKAKAEEKAKQEADVKAKAEEKAKQEADAKAKQEADAKAKEAAENKAKAEKEAQDKAEKEAVEKAKKEAEEKAEKDKVAKVEEDKKAKEELDIPGALRSSFLISPRFLAPAPVMRSAGMPGFSPYDVPNQWNLIKGDASQFNPEGGHNISYNIYAEKKNNRPGINIEHNQFDYEPTQRYLTFEGFAVQKGYNNEYPDNNRTYIIMENTKTGESKTYATDVMADSDATRDFTWAFGTPKQPRQCYDNEFDKWSDDDCTMTYKGVGFKAYIPLDDLFGNAKMGDDASSWNMKIVHGVNGNHGRSGYQYVWTWITTPINILDLGKYTSREGATGMLDFASGRGTNTATPNTADHIRRDSPAGNGLCSLGSNCRYFKMGVDYPILDSDQSRTVIWYKYGARAGETQDAWGQSQYFHVNGKTAMLTFKPDKNVVPDKDVQLKTVYVNDGNRQVLDSFTEKFSRGEQVTRSVPFNKQGGKTESEFYADTYRLFNKKIYTKNVNGEDFVFRSQEQNPSQKADDDMVRELKFNMHNDVNARAKGQPTDVDKNDKTIIKSGGDSTGDSTKVRYYDLLVNIEYIDKTTGKILEKRRSKVIPHGRVVYVPKPTGAFKDENGNPYISVNPYAEEPVKSWYTHPGQHADDETTIKFYYKPSKPDPSTNGHVDGELMTDNADFTWNLYKDDDKSKSKLALHNKLDPKLSTKAFAVRNVKKVIETANTKNNDKNRDYIPDFDYVAKANEVADDGMKYHLIGEEKTPKNKVFMSTLNENSLKNGGAAYADFPNISGISKDMQVLKNDPDAFKDASNKDYTGRNLYYGYQFEATNSYYDHYVCSGWDEMKDEKGNPLSPRQWACEGWNFSERIPLWGDGTDKYTPPAGTWIDTHKVAYQAEIELDHVYGTEHVFRKGDQKLEYPVGRQSKVYRTSPNDYKTDKEDKTLATEKFIADKTLYDAANPAKELQTQEAINVGGTLKYENSINTMGIANNGGLGSQISYDRDLKYMSEDGKRSAVAWSDSDGRPNNGYSGYYVQDVDKNLKESLVVNKDKDDVEFDKHHALGFYKLPVVIEGKGGGQFDIKTMDDYRVMKNSGFQVASPKGASIDAVNKQAREEYRKFNKVEATTSDLVLESDKRSSKYYLPLDVDTSVKGKDDLPSMNMKVKSKWQNELLIGSVGLNDVIIQVTYPFTFKQYLVGSGLDKAKDGQDAVYVNEQTEAISKGVKYDHKVRIEDDELKGAIGRIKNSDTVKINTFREANSKGLWESVKEYLK
ncbi:hypothetical protein [Bacillus cereus]|uniref:hypothetical protein n=1 Tax=Bacillus cereus TaxID=1396 RepID=UPI001C8CB112|nr:hypothetical protein [Bacillus cereus]MBX9158261.1 hypothetical protein [Bacillus cereus]